jgi:hypothetical protein
VASDFQNLEAAGEGMEIDNNVLDAGEGKQLRQAPGHGDEPGLILLRGLVEDAGKARNADGFVSRQPDTDWLRNASRRHLATPKFGSGRIIYSEAFS